ncbi:DUF1127 domain-containing protein [Entomohabitans teleogrylli]|uniref:DUF1127 domain-containing protein n=1 Tax=Entomohabitans teleogrylli TaxID=1384589 RepID=UPI0008FC6926|nr:DUF1127 domain-containing protein [Entomohabitans teleogrylli]
MEFYENRPRRPFIGFVLIWRALKKGYLRRKARHQLQRMNDAQLRELGVRREDIG